MRQAATSPCLPATARLPAATCACGAAAMRCSRRCSRCWSWCCSRWRWAAKRARSPTRGRTAVLWVAVLLAGLLALDTLFRGDAEDGSLEQWMLAPVPLAWLVLVRTAHPLGHHVAAARDRSTPLLGELLHLPREQLPVLLASVRSCWARRC
jgi:hypothetical protein